MTPPLVTLADVEAAHLRVAGSAVRTPVLEVAGAAAGRPLALKCESLQPMGAFKIRGAANMLALLGDRAAAGVITYSSGNHGQAVALAAQRAGCRAVVVMPETATRVKVEGARRYGAEVIVAGTTSLERKARAEAEAAAQGLTIVPPFDHPWIVAGAGTVGLEILDQHPAVTSVFVPMGGGGLVAGVAAAIKQRAPHVRIVGAEPEGAPKMTRSRAAGAPVTLERSASIADGLLNVRPGDLTFAHVQAYVDDIVAVPEDAIVAALRWLFREARLVAEPSGAVATAAALALAAEGATRTGPSPVAIVSGGNISADDFARFLAG